MILATFKSVVFIKKVQVEFQLHQIFLSQMVKKISKLALKNTHDIIGPLFTEFTFGV